MAEEPTSATARSWRDVLGRPVFGRSHGMASTRPAIPTRQIVTAEPPKY